VDTLRALVFNYTFLTDACTASVGSAGGGGGVGGHTLVEEKKKIEIPELDAGCVARWSSGVPMDAAMKVQILDVQTSGEGGLHGTVYEISDGAAHMSAKAFVTLHGRLDSIGKFGIATIEGNLVQAGFDPDPTRDWLLIRAVEPPGETNPGLVIDNPTHISQQVLRQMPVLMHKVEGNQSPG
jgi:hypothetical protein